MYFGAILRLRLDVTSRVNICQSQANKANKGFLRELASWLIFDYAPFYVRTTNNGNVNVNRNRNRNGYGYGYGNDNANDNSIRLALYLLILVNKRIYCGRTLINFRLSAT